MDKRADFWVVSIFLLAMLGAAAVVLAEEGSYTVRPGDTLAGIARAYDLTPADLAAANHIVNPNLIYAGQILLIPGAASTAPETGDHSMTRRGDHMAHRFQEHVVQPGENLFRIAVRYGLTVADLQQTNRLGDVSIIYPGQRLLIPANGVTLAQSSPLLPPAPTSTAKSIVVDKSQQRAYVYEDGELLWSFVVSTGQPGSETWSGTFAVRSKTPEGYAYNWGLRMPYWIGFYHTGYLENGFHALPIMSNGAILWDGYLGTPVSYGCVILSYADAETLYAWAEIGTEVIVQP